MSYAVQIAAKDCHKTIGLFIDRNAVSFKTLKENVTFIKRLTPSIFASNQLPEEIVTSTGRVIHKPNEWYIIYLFNQTSKKIRNDNKNHAKLISYQTSKIRRLEAFLSTP